MIAAAFIAVGASEMIEAVTALLERAGGPADWLFELVAPSMLMIFGAVVLIGWIRGYWQYTRYYQRVANRMGAEK